MRKILLAGVALATAAAFMPATANAQATSSPVTVYIGGRLFQGIFPSHSTGQNDGLNKYSSVSYPNYFRLYPSADYAAPSGVHYGFSGEIRSNGGVNKTNGTLYWQRAYGYVTSAKFGSLEFGTPVPVLEKYAVGVNWDYGTGGFDGEYGWNGANGTPLWLFPDNNDTTTSIQYTTPTYAGFLAAFNFSPSQNNLGSNNQTTSTSDPLNPAINKYSNRVQGTINYGGTFGALGLKANVGGQYSGVVHNTVPATAVTAAGENAVAMSILDAGLAVTYAGVTAEAHVDTGYFGAGWTPLKPHSSPTTAAIAGLTYTIPNPAVPLAMGAGYYWYQIDANNYTFVAGTAPAAHERVIFNGAQVGASYKWVPGVTFFLDGLYGVQRAPSGSELVVGNNKVTSYGLGLGTYFQW